MFANFNAVVWATRLMAALVFMVIGFVLGWKVSNYKCVAAQVAMANQLVAQAAQQGQVTDKAVTQFVDKQVKRAAAHIAIKKDIHNEVPADLILPPAYRVLHDAAATGIIPGSSDVADARPVAASDLAETVAENYAACEANRQQLTSLQDWLKNEQGVVLH